VRVRQVFQNLLENAIKYMGVGHDRRIRIRCGDVENAVEFQVIDTGIGITPDEAERVFYAFRRGTNHTGIAGKGVGLAGVKAIVETYDGTIRCEPGEAIGQPGGTVFRFTIDRRHVGPKPAAARADDSGGGLVADADAHFDGVANEDPAVRPGVARAA